MKLKFATILLHERHVFSIVLTNDILIITFNTETREKRLNLALRIDVMLFAATKQSQTITNNIKGSKTIFNS